MNIAGSDGTGTVSFSEPNLPTGYSISPASISFDNPAGSTSTTINIDNAFTLSDGVTENDFIYELSIVFLTLPLAVTEFTLALTPPLGADIPIDADHIELNLSVNTLTVTESAGLMNLNENNLGFSSQWTLALTPIQGASVTFSTANLTFSDIAGTEDGTANLGSFIATRTSDSSSTSFSVSLAFLKTYNIQLDTTTTTVASTESGASYTIPSCNKLPSFSVFTIDSDGATNTLNNATATLSSTVSSYYDEQTAANNTNNFTVSAFDANNDALEQFNLKVIVQQCSANENNFAGGDGSSGSPWLIDNDLRLNIMSELVNGSSHDTYYNDYYQLTADVDMGNNTLAPWSDGSTHPQKTTNGFTPIGKQTSGTSALSTQDREFAGRLNCANYSISNLFISNTGNDAGGWYVGLFGVTTNGSRIGNCTLSNASISGYQRVGSLVGYVDNKSSTSYITNNTIIDSSISATKNYLGGIVGQTVSQAKIYVTNNTINTSSITTSSGSDVGGIVGYALAEAASNIVNSNSVIGATITGSGSRIGGVIGSAYSSNSLVQVTTSLVSNTQITGSEHVGGLIGRARVFNDSTGVKVSLASVIGSTVTANTKAGGAFGAMWGGQNTNTTIDRAFIAATVFASNGVSGGITAHLTVGKFTNVLFVGTVGANSGDIASGSAFRDSTSSSPFNYSYTIAVKSGNPDNTYGLSESGYNIDQSYYNNSVFAASRDSDGKSTSQLRSPITNTGIYSSWGATIWDFGTSSQFPVLEGLPISKSLQCQTINALLSTTTNCDSY